MNDRANTQPTDDQKTDLILKDEYPIGEDSRSKFTAKARLTFVFRHDLILLDMDFGHAPNVANPPRDVITGRTPLDGLRNAIAAIDTHLANARATLLAAKRTKTEAVEAAPTYYAAAAEEEG